MPKLISSDVETSLRARIAAGEWASDSRLPPERDLAAEYGVARNTVRRAVEAIVADGTIRRHVGRGSFIARDHEDIARIVQRTTGVSPADLMAVRFIVEPSTAAVAATMASRADLDAIAEAHEEASRARETERFEHWDAEFHQRIFAAARNELLMSLHDILRTIRNRNTWIELKKKTFSENRRLDYCDHHAEILAALTRRDADGAAAAMRVHLEAIQITLFGRP
ncbi:FadR/GntR family transcriptional regulator [Amorphus orientalis]|uniref:DNA-binding FadR family transcriptional regulator n=1 Tax=Amorphus orientalis TaxID=649198 RepID=A0AAE3VKK8_9HYPH|nr:FCD domain-containing protein [Amorphus orientalis]MDQ0313643.1 DNA-binding FadR family transcriptional regulator [Amorphus orientalis]